MGVLIAYFSVRWTMQDEADRFAARAMTPHGFGSQVCVQRFPRPPTAPAARSRYPNAARPSSALPTSACVAAARPPSAAVLPKSHVSVAVPRSAVLNDFFHARLDEERRVFGVKLSQAEARHEAAAREVQRLRLELAQASSPRERKRSDEMAVALREARGRRVEDIWRKMQGVTRERDEARNDAYAAALESERLRIDNALLRAEVARRSAAPTAKQAPAATATTAAWQDGASWFLSGVMGGSGTGKNSTLGIAMESQDYRGRMHAAIVAVDPSAVLIDPLDIGAKRAATYYPPGTPTALMWKDDTQVRDTLEEAVSAAAASDVVVSYLPTASMGSALELHAARAAGRLVVVIAPGGSMATNWVVRAYAHKVLESIEEFAEWLASTAPTSTRHGDVES